MCNLYSMTANQSAILEVARAMRDTTGNLPSMPAIFPDAAAPIVREGADSTRELVLARWGMPSPAFALKGRKVDRGVTNVRNTASPHWRRWLGPQSRCLVPMTSFSENEKTANGFEPAWFALSDERPLTFFAGVWTNWTSTRKLAEGEITIDLFAFLTTEPNKEVAVIHPKAMPVILSTADDREQWLQAPWEDAKALQRPLPDGALTIVSRGSRSDKLSKDLTPP